METWKNGFNWYVGLGVALDPIVLMIIKTLMTVMILLPDTFVFWPQVI